MVGSMADIMMTPSTMVNKQIRGLRLDEMWVFGVCITVKYTRELSSWGSVEPVQVETPSTSAPCIASSFLQLN